VRGRAQSFANGECSGLVEMLQHLDDEQRVAFGVSRHQSCERRRRVTADPFLDDVADVIVREPMERDSRVECVSAQRLHQIAKL
jgi:hypothetical protein